MSFTVITCHPFNILHVRTAHSLLKRPASGRRRIYSIMCPTDARHAALHKQARHCSTVTHWPSAATGDASASVEHSKLNALLGRLGRALALHCSEYRHYNLTLVKHGRRK